MKLFLTGGTGFVGSEILKQLTKDGHEVRCLVRPDSKKELAVREGVEIVNGDITQPESLSGKMEGCEAVIHLVGIIRAFPAKGITFEKIHYEGSRNVIDEAKRAGIERFLHMSALGASAEAKALYHQTKYKAEQYLKQSGLNYTIFRPSVIFGPGGEFVEMLAKMVRMGPIVPVIGNGRFKMQPVAIQNVAQGYLRALSNPVAQGKIYEIGGPEQFEYDQILDVFATNLGRKIIKFHQPVALVKPMVCLLERFSFFPLGSDQLLMMKDNVCDPQLFCKDLGVELISFSEGLKKCL